LVLVWDIRHLRRLGKLFCAHRGRLSRRSLEAKAEVYVHVVIDAGGSELAAGAALVDADPGWRLERPGAPSIGDEFDPAPAWYRNLMANPSATFRTPKATFQVVARELDDTERAEVWERIVRFNPLYGAFQACTERTIPVVSLERRPEAAAS
jgi:deazaflavin-dependent oxidoreductase (nitroreductase family)